MDLKCQNHHHIQLVTLFLLIIVNLNVDATYDIDDAILYRVSFNGEDDKLTQNNRLGGLGKTGGEEVKLTKVPSTVFKPVLSQGGPSTVSIPDHSDMTLKRNDETDSEEESLDTVTMLSRHGEKYTCTIPRTDKVDKDRGGGKSGYEGQTALALLEPLFVSQSCAYRLEHYWTYELCHGRFLRQYHEEREGKTVKLDEYYLGKYDKDTYNADIEAIKDQVRLGKNKKPQKKRVETMNMPYLELTMKDGTICDLNGLPRMARVQYVCYPSGKHEMYSFKETTTCEYEVMVLSPLLCSHPDYRPESSNEQHINCKPANKESATKPLDLVRDEAESLEMRTRHKMYEADFFQGAKGAGSVKIEIKPVNPFDAKKNVEMIRSTDDVENDEEETVTDGKTERWSKNRREPAKPLTDSQIVREFLMGDHCLYGGTGWWKYEFCYGKTVKQYHEDKGERVQLINLGNFDKTKHIKWLKQNPSKLPKTVEFRKHVSHFYSDGDFCEESGKPRQIEVKLKCKPSQSVSAVTLYLLEPKTCEYILGVESPLICDILNRADVHGIMEVYPSMDGTIVTDDETLDDLVEKAGSRKTDELNTEAGEDNLPVLKSPRSSGVTDKVTSDQKLNAKVNEKQRGTVSESLIKEKGGVKGNYINKDELINDIEAILKTKFDKKTKTSLDFETFKKLSKDKLAEIIAEKIAETENVLSTHKYPTSDFIDKLYKKVKHDIEESDELNSDYEDDDDDSTEYEELKDSPNE